ncbi:MAG: enoyl-CoA hydratase/isomerase family protein, partial [Proteobacteria bacterium]|nr:enoyl-CoA hydratase/isomerase family protein [Pseudomonadota bacterium]
MPATVTCAVVDGIATVTLNRPERLNAINPRLLEDLLAALTACGADKATKAIILTGAGRAFCAGDDLKEFGEQSRDEKTVRAYVEQIQDV